jgi:uncharacterized membrane protein YecN with MAPEG domain
MDLLNLPPLNTFALYAAVNGLIMLFLAIMVVRQRVLTRTDIGDGGHAAMVQVQRAHGNSAEYVPIVLIMLYLLVQLGAPLWMLHTVGGLLTVGRVLHAVGLYGTTGRSAGRFIGTNLTWLALLVGAVASIYYALATA